MVISKLDFTCLRCGKNPDTLENQEMILSFKTE
jgi:hypothetical protein